MTPDELHDRIDVLEDALRWISTHCITGETGQRRMQLVAVDAIRDGLRPEESIAKRKGDQP